MDHLDAFLASSHHLDMPTFDPSELLACIKQLVQLDKEWLKAVSYTHLTLPTNREV